MPKPEKVWESVPKPEKVLESVPKFVKIWERLLKVEKIWESVLKVEKVWESVLKVEKVCKKLRKFANSWESMRKCAKSSESVLIVQKVCQNLRKYVITIEHWNFFWNFYVALLLFVHTKYDVWEWKVGYGIATSNFDLKFSIGPQRWIEIWRLGVETGISHCYQQFCISQFRICSHFAKYLQVVLARLQWRMINVN